MFASTTFILVLSAHLDSALVCAMGLHLWNGSDLFDLKASLIYKKHLGAEKLTLA